MQELKGVLVRLPTCNFISSGARPLKDEQTASMHSYVSAFGFVSCGNLQLEGVIKPLSIRICKSCTQWSIIK